MTCFNPPNPLFKGAHQASVRTGAHGHRFAVLRPASDDALSILRTVLFRLPSPEKVSDVEWCAQRVINYVSVFYVLSELPKFQL